MKKFLLFLVLFFMIPLYGEEINWDELNYKIKTGLGAPDLLYIAIAVSSFNKFEIEAGAGTPLYPWFSKENLDDPVSYYIRAGYPFTRKMENGKGFLAQFVPMAGYKRLRFGWIDYNAGEGYDHKIDSRTVDIHGLDLTGSGYLGYMFFKHFGLFSDLTIGATVKLYGKIEDKIEYYEGKEESYRKTDEEITDKYFIGQIRLGVGLIF